MSQLVQTSVHPRSATYPISWSFELAGLVIGAGATVTRNPLFIDYLNKSTSPLFIPPPTPQPVVGFEEVFSFNLAAGPIANVTLRRQFSLDNAAYFTVVDTALVVGTVTSIVISSSALRFPTYPFFRYQFINLDGVNAQTITGVLTLRAR